MALFAKPKAAQNAAEIITLVPEPPDVETAAAFADIEPDPPTAEEPDPTPRAETAAVEPDPTTVAETTSEAATSDTASGTQVSSAPTETPATAPVAPATVLQSPPSVTAVGDSVMLGAAYSLAGSIPGIDLDAAVGRQASAAIGLLQQKAAAGLLGQVVIVHIGNNGTFTSAEFDQIMALVGPDRTAIFLSLHVPRQWEAGNNAVIVDGVSRYANARLVDWATAGNTYPELLYNDGIHLTPAGAAYYTQLIVAALGG